MNRHGKFALVMQASLLKSEVVLQNVLRELEQKKPQLDELVHTAENLKADSNRQQLHGKGEPRLYVI